MTKRISSGKRPMREQRPREATMIMPTTRQDGAESKNQKAREKLPETRRAGPLQYGLLVLLVILSFFPIFGNQMLWSEHDSVIRSPYQSMDSWKELFNLDLVRHEDPITTATFIIEDYLPFPRAIFHRALNLILHLVAAVLLLRLLELFKFPGAYGAVLIFALHPAVLQTLFWPGYRGQIIALIFLISALFYGVRNANQLDFTKSIVLTFITSIMQPIGLAIPFVLGLCIIYQRKAFHLPSLNRILPLLCISTFIVVWSQTGVPVNPEKENSVFLNSLNLAGDKMFFYIEQSLAPLELGLFHPYAEESRNVAGAELSLLPFFLFVPFYMLIAFNFRRRWAKAILLGLTTFLLLVIPNTSSIGYMVDGTPALENHGQYISLPFIIALVIISFVSAMRFVGARAVLFSKAVISLAVVVEIFLSASFSYAVGDQIRLWQGFMAGWPESRHIQLAYLESIRTDDGFAVDDEGLIRLLTQVAESEDQEIAQEIELARAYVRIDQFENAARIYRRLLGDTEPSNALLEEAAQFFDQAGFMTEANMARQRIK
ncbi:MAG: hypothetical protein AAF546_03620 [Verrucomicrobiota bacterium]